MGKPRTDAIDGMLTDVQATLIGEAVRAAGSLALAMRTSGFRRQTLWRIRRGGEILVTGATFAKARKLIGRFTPEALATFDSAGVGALEFAPSVSAASRDARRRARALERALEAAAGIDAIHEDDPSDAQHALSRLGSLRDYARHTAGWQQLDSAVKKSGFAVDRFLLAECRILNGIIELVSFGAALSKLEEAVRGTARSKRWLDRHSERVCATS